MPIKFTITSKTAAKAEGTLTWTEKSLTANAVSGPFGNGFIESGLYQAKRNVLLDKPGEAPYCDKSNPSNCWFQLLTPQFTTARTEIGIHPDGNTPGTAGCIGITIPNTKPWYDALKSVAAGQYTAVEVIDTTILNAKIITLKSKLPRKLKKLKKKLLILANPCDNSPAWGKAPSPSSNPLAAMVWATGTTKDKFGCTRTNADGSKKFHAGIDIKAVIGTDCFATEDSTVTDVGSGLDLGSWVAISFNKGGKKYGVAYCHLSKQSVKNADKLKKGDKVGETGISGNAEIYNPHLHLEVQDQVWVAYSSTSDRSKHGLDPNEYINAIV